jgi:type I restriction enzyme M protein
VRVFSLNKHRKRSEFLKDTSWGELASSSLAGVYLGKMILEIENKNPVFNGISDSFKFERSDKKLDQLIHKLVSNIDALPLSDENDLGLIMDTFLQSYSVAIGKMGTEFSTPSSINLLIKSLIGTKVFESAYDPCIGTGTFLSFSPKQIKSFDGQEINMVTRSKSLKAHYIAGHRKFNIELSDSLQSPLQAANKLRRYDLIISSPPFNIPIEQSNVERLKDDKWGRFRAGVSRDSNWAFVQHILSSLNEAGVGFVILPMGPLFSGGLNKEIREKLIRTGYIDTVIQLPSGLFSSTSIPVVLLVLKKTTRKENSIFFIKAIKLGKINKRERFLTEEDISEISKSYLEKKDIPEFSRLVSFEEIIERDFTLNPLRYIEDKVIETRMDLDQVLSNIEEANQAAEKSKKSIIKELKNFGVNL